MCHFRLITAEEEAASAVYHALKRRGYKGAERLSPKRHIHKMALRPFILSMHTLLLIAGHVRGVEVAPELDPDDQDRFRVRIKLPDKEMVFSPPLDLSLSENGKAYDFSNELRLVLDRHEVDSILAYVKNETAERRRLLYAGTEGMWGMTDAIDEDFLRARRGIVLSHLLLFLMIDAYPKRQLFVEQCLPTLLRLLELLPSDETVLDA
jgi:hypothetical protein